MRTSHSHPLQIATVSHPDHPGRIGITFCPGKKQPGAMTGGWDRDLGIDLDAIANWGTAAVVTLVEDHELASLKVDGLGAAVAGRHMSWFHLPIPDVSVPSKSFEIKWAESGERLRNLLRQGFSVVVHCKGGLGRAGTVSARLLTELGIPAGEAISAVRSARPGAIETREQETHVKGIVPVPERLPGQAPTDLEDRAAGALLGLAVGDAVGTTLEFKARDSYKPISDMVGGGPFHLKPGEWTDDTAMALALADSFLSEGDLNEADLLRRFVQWREQGAYSCTGHCFDIGITTANALQRWKREGVVHAGSTDPSTAGNGSLMRLSPVALRYWNNREQLRDAAARQSKTTHAAAEAVDACIVYAEALADAIEGLPRSAVLRNREENFSGAIQAIVAGSWRNKRRDQINASGYVAHSLEASLWAVARTSDFRSAVLLAANLGQDADTTAAITGQLAGAIYGASGIPSEWVSRVAWGSRIQDMARELFGNSRPGAN